MQHLCYILWVNVFVVNRMNTEMMFVVFCCVFCLHADECGQMWTDVDAFENFRFCQHGCGSCCGLLYLCCVLPFRHFMTPSLITGKELVMLYVGYAFR